MPSSYLAPGLEGRFCRESYGRGVFTARRVAAGDVVAVFGGSVLDVNAMMRASPSVRRRSLQIEEGFFLYSNVSGPADWINHSCMPNCGFRGPTTLVALRDLEEGEEVTFDYAMSDGTGYDEFPCGCGAPLCRGFVSGSDWARPELWTRYQGYFSPYLERRIAIMREELDGQPQGGPRASAADPSFEQP